MPMNTRPTNLFYNFFQILFKRILPRLAISLIVIASLLLLLSIPTTCHIKVITTETNKVGSK